MLNINKTNLNTETVYKAVSQNLPNAHRPGRLLALSWTWALFRLCGPVLSK